MNWRQRNRPARPEARREVVNTGLAQRNGIDAFELFCAYHLGITAENGYAFQNIHQVAKRFKTNAAVIRQILSELGMDPDAIVHSSFDLASAKVDIMLAPEGVSRVELARELYQEFRQAPRRDRNWAKELAEDARENERIFGGEPSPKRNR
ncbi:MAG: hypothetical protein HY027_05890 [Deltaproteobacteria bacterium]|nr:hypothetical protein [Deltaproteobacteria bacterium]